MACHIANCCCCSVRTGSLVLGVLWIIGSIIGIISDLTKDQVNDYYLGVIGYSVTLVISILLVVGVHKDSSKLVRPCVYYYPAYIIFTIIIMIVAIVGIKAAVDDIITSSGNEALVEGWNTGGGHSVSVGSAVSTLAITTVVIVGAIRILIGFFCWLCVYSYLQDLESQDMVSPVV